jgi:hypothetical protein
MTGGYEAEGGREGFKEAGESTFTIPSTKALAPSLPPTPLPDRSDV